MRIIIVLFFLLPLAAFADDCRGNQPCNNSTVDIANDITTNVGIETGPTTVNAGDVAVNSDSKSFAFAHGLGDVDINQCLASTQWGTILVSKQKVVLNKWCAAESYDARGLHTMAALIRCDIPEISKLFNDKEKCIRANTYSPPPEPVTVIVPAAEPDVEQLAQVEEEHESLEQRLARLERNQRAAAAKAQERRDVAQETYQKIKELRTDERDH
jgi:hypothetical protein